MMKSNDNVNQSGKGRKGDNKEARKEDRKDEVLDLVHTVMHQYLSLIHI